MFDTDPGRRRPILFIEDSEADALLFQRALGRIGATLPIEVLTDGEAAWERLLQSADSHESLPSLILLDLRLPRKTGLEILAALKGHDVLRRIPVIVMTSSDEKADIDRVYAFGADFYLLKRIGLEKVAELAAAIQAYWAAVTGDPDQVGSDPSLSLLRKLAERPGMESVRAVGHP